MRALVIGLALATSFSAHAFNETTCSLKIDGKVILAKKQVAHPFENEETVLFSKGDVKVSLRSGTENTTRFQVSAIINEHDPKTGKAADRSSVIQGQMMPLYQGSTTKIDADFHYVQETSSPSKHVRIQAECTNEFGD